MAVQRVGRLRAASPLDDFVEQRLDVKLGLLHDAGPAQYLDRVDGGGADADQHLAWTGLGLSDFPVLEDLWGTVPVENDGVHRIIRSDGVRPIAAFCGQ